MEACNAVSVEGLVCGRPEGHGGQHEAHVGSVPSRWWGDTRDGQGKHEDDASYDGIRIEELWLFATVGPDNQEGVAAVEHPTHGLLPLIATDATRLEVVKRLAARVESEDDTRLRLLHFTGPPEVIESWRPSASLMDHLRDHPGAE